MSHGQYAHISLRQALVTACQITPDGFDLEKRSFNFTAALVGVLDLTDPELANAIEAFLKHGTPVTIKVTA